MSDNVVPLKKQDSPETGQALRPFGSSRRRNRLSLLSMDDVLLAEFRGTKAMRTIDRMMVDPIISGIVLRTGLLMRAPTWTVEPGGEEQIDQEFADFVSDNFEGLRHGWQATLAHAAEMIGYGFSLFEVLYKRTDEGDIVWADFSPRDARTIEHWDLDDLGDLMGVVQRKPMGGTVNIPAWKLVHFRTTPISGRPEGKSFLRNSFIPWTDKQELRRILKVGLRRDLTGVVELQVPPAILHPDASDEEKATLTRAEKLAQEVERDEREGIVMPAEKDADGNVTGWKLGLLQSGGRRQFDLDKVMELYNREMALGMIAEFVLLGHEQVGTFSLASQKTEMFARAIGSLLDDVAGEMRHRAFGVLRALNPRFASAELPKLEHSDIEEQALEEIAEYVRGLTSTGAIIPDPALEESLRARAGLPQVRGEEEL